MRIFVAGATGVIGRRVVPLLLADGHVVAGMTRSDHQAVAHLGAEPVTVRKLMARVADGDLAVGIRLVPGDRSSLLAGRTSGRPPRLS